MAKLKIEKKITVPSVSIGFRCKKTLRTKIDAECKKLNRTLSDLIVSILNKYFNN